MPYEITVDDGLRMIGAKPMKGADLPDGELAADERPAPDDERPYFGTHNLVRELVTVGCFNCEQPLTPETAQTACPGDPGGKLAHVGPDGRDLLPNERVLAGGNVAPGAIDGVGRNDPCPCGSGLKFKRCHGG